MTDDDLDMQEDFDKGPSSDKPSLKEVWESSPVLKIVAVAVGLGVLAGAYTIFFSGAEEEAVKAKIRIIGTERAKQIPGQKELDPAYEAALKEANKKSADEAAAQGGSSLPTPIGTAKKSSIDVPEMPQRPTSDVLAEWRKATQNNARMRAALEAVEEEGNAPSKEPVPEVVPMVQPIRPQAQQQMAVKQDPNDAKRLADQMRVIIAAQAPGLAKSLTVTAEESPYIVMKKEEAAAKATQEKQELATGSGSGSGADSADEPGRTIVPAGSIAYAQLLTELNSDVEGPVLAQVLSGPFAGGRMIGKVQVKDEYMVINFTRAIKDTVSYKMEGVALDEKTTLAGQATDVDHHYMVRIVLPAAAAFVSGYGSAIAETGSSVEQTDGGAQAAEKAAPSPKESLYKGLEKASTKIGEMMDKQADRPITVKIAKGTTMGVFFVDTVTTKDAEE